MGSNELPAADSMADEIMVENKQQLPDAGAEADSIINGPKAPLSGKFADYFFGVSPIAKTLSDFGQGAAQNWGDAPLGKDAEAAFRKAGVFNDYSKNSGTTLKAINESLIRPFLSPLDAASRTISSTMAGVSNVLSKSGSELEETAKKLQESDEHNPYLSPYSPSRLFPTLIGGTGEIIKNIPQGFLPELPFPEEAAKARASGVIGEGEEGYYNTAPVTPENMEARQEAAQRAGIPIPPVTPVQTDIHALAREVAPDVMQEYDAKVAFHQELTERLNSLQLPDFITEGQPDFLRPKSSELEATEEAFKENYNRLQELQPYVDQAYDHAESLIPPKEESLLGETPSKAEISTESSKETPIDVDTISQQVLADHGGIIDKSILDQSGQSEIDDTRGRGIFFHGTSKPIEYLQDYPGGSESNIYGQGLYSTDAADIAKGYSKKGKGLSRTVYQVNKSGKENLVDMEAPIGGDVEKVLNEFAQHSELLAIALEEHPKNLREVYNEMRAASSGEGISKSEVQEQFDGLAYNFEKLGYTGLEHRGGLLTGKKPHTVQIHWTPETHGISLTAREDLTKMKSETPPTTPVGEESRVRDAQKPVQGKESVPGTGQPPQNEAVSEAPRGSGEGSGNGRLEAVEGTGETKTRGLAKNIEASAIEKGLTEGFGHLDEYKTVDIKDQAAKALDLLTSDPEKALNIALGKEAPPSGLHPESVLVAVEKDATARGDVETLRQLATNSHLSVEATTMGQRLRILGERDETSPVSAIKAVQDARDRALERSTKMTSAKEQVIKDIKSQIDKYIPSKEDWQSFIKSIECDY